MVSPYLAFLLLLLAYCAAGWIDMRSEPVLIASTVTSEADTGMEQIEAVRYARLDTGECK